MAVIHFAEPFAIAFERSGKMFPHRGLRGLGLPTLEGVARVRVFFDRSDRSACYLDLFLDIETCPREPEGTDANGRNFKTRSVTFALDISRSRGSVLNDCSQTFRF
jgi:hypothetical protein